MVRPGRSATREPGDRPAAAAAVSRRAIGGGLPPNPTCRNPRELDTTGHAGVHGMGVQAMGRRFAAALIGAVPLAAVLPAAATDSSDRIETLIVTATRRPTPAEAVLAPVTVIDRAMLARSLAPDVVDVLRFNAGLDVGRTGGPGQPASIFIRGAESNHTLVLIDGVRVNPGTIGGAALQNIPPQLVERIEIVRGPRSSLYGTDAIGGVINVITRRPPQGKRFEVRAGAGSYESREADLFTSLAGDAGQIGGGVSWIESRGFPTRSVDTTERGFENLAFNAFARTQLGTTEIGLRHWQAEGTSEYSDFFLTPLDQDFRNTVTSVTVDHGSTEVWSTRLTLSRIEDRIEQNDLPDYLLTERYSLDWQNDFDLTDRQRLTAGVLLQYEDADSLSFGSAFDARTRIANAYVQDSVEFGPHALLLAAGYTDHETFGGHATWNAEYGIALNGATRLSFAAGSAFRAPDATDRYGFAGNPALEPEESLSYEIGLRHQIGDHQTFSLTAFQNEIDDLIEYVVVDPETFAGELRNVDQARIRGIEAGYVYAADAWQLRAQLSLQDPENRTTGAQLFRRTRESLTIGATRDFGRLSFGADLLYAGPREDFGFPEPAQLDAYTLVNLSARWRLSRSISVLARVENVLDEQYELASTYNTPDRSVFVAVRYHHNQ